MLTFIETRLFSRLPMSIFQMISCRVCSVISRRTRRPGISFGSLVAFENCAGAQRVAGNAADFESFTT